MIKAFYFYCKNFILSEYFNVRTLKYTLNELCTCVYASQLSCKIKSRMNEMINYLLPTSNIIYKKIYDLNISIYSY